MKSDRLSAMFARLNEADQPAKPSDLTDHEKRQLPPDLTQLTLRQLEEAVKIIAQKRMDTRVTESGGILKFNDRLFKNIAAQCRQAIENLAQAAREKAASEAEAAREKAEEEVRLSNPFNKALEAFKSVPADPVMVQEAAADLIKRGLLKDDKKWWRVNPANYDLAASRELANAVNEKRTVAFTARINASRSLPELYKVGEDLKRKDLIHFFTYNPDDFFNFPEEDEERLLRQNQLAESNYDNRNTWGLMPSALAEAFNIKRGKFIAEKLERGRTSASDRNTGSSKANRWR